MSKQVAMAPVVLIIFNRPDLTAKVIEQISRSKPTKLFIIADGAREHKFGEIEKCLEARKMVEHISWECEVFRDYSDTNLGCRNRIATGLDWVFKQVDRAIILEDDCIPDPSFFQYCTDLLQQYEADNRIGCISGTAMSDTSQIGDQSYYFSRYPLVWGWATWRRVWQHYDVEVSDWGKLRDTDWLKSITHEDEFSHWQKAFNGVFEKRVDTWDYQLVFSIWKQRQLTIQPRVNLISNIGFRDDATHTKEDHRLSNLPREALSFPLRHPMNFNPNYHADEHYRLENCQRRINRNKIKAIWNIIKS